MNMFSYIDKYGYYTFEEVGFNEVDNLVFSSLSYVNFLGIVGNNKFGCRTIRGASKEFFANYNKNNKGITAIKHGVKVLKAIMDTRRYGSLPIYNYSYVGDDKQQFSAITIEINRKLVYVSYEGTDQLVSGWKEDFMMSYMFPVLSQRRAIDYLNRHFMFRHKNIILGGHSKGGNLALVAGMYANFLVKDRIVNIYNNDGPGLRKSEIESKYYKSIEDKIIHIIPNYSIIGLLLRHNDKYISIRSYKKSIYAHDMSTWIVRDDRLERHELSSFSKIIDEGMIEWLNKYDYSQREKFVNSLFMVFERAGVRNFNDVLENKKLLFKIIMETGAIDKETKKILKDFILFLFKYFKDAKVDSLLNKKNKTE